MLRGQEYIDELAGVVVLPGLMDCSLMDFAARIKQLIALLCDAAKEAEKELIDEGVLL